MELLAIVIPVLIVLAGILVFAASLIGGVIEAGRGSGPGLARRAGFELLPIRVQPRRGRRVRGGRSTRGPPRR